MLGHVGFLSSTVEACLIPLLRGTHWLGQSPGQEPVSGSLGKLLDCPQGRIWVHRPLINSSGSCPPSQGCWEMDAGCGLQQGRGF